MNENWSMYCLVELEGEEVLSHMGVLPDNTFKFVWNYVKNEPHHLQAGGPKD
jgi:hypothetical protein